MLKLGSIELDVPFFQAALSGYSDYPMRVLAREFGAPLALTGVMLDRIALHPKAVRKLLFRLGDEPHPVGAQIMGSDAETMAAAAKTFAEMGYDLIDLNFACPAPKVVRRQRGGNLLKHPREVVEIVRRVREAVATPLLIKLRKGFDESEASREDFWRICEESIAAGVDGLVIHGRTVMQRYRGEADWEILGEVKRRFPGAVIAGSGDLMDAETCAAKMKASGVDGFAVARGAVGNPWLFAELRALFEGKAPPVPPTMTEQAAVIMRHFEMILAIKPERKAIPYFRKFLAGYTKRHPQRKKVLLGLIEAKNTAELFARIQRYYGADGEPVI